MFLQARGICSSCALELGILHNCVPARGKSGGMETLLLWGWGGSRQLVGPCYTSNSALSGLQVAMSGMREHNTV